MNRNAVVTLLLGATFFLNVAYADVSDFEMHKSKDAVTFVRADGSVTAQLRILRSVNSVSTTKEYARYVMDRYRGWGLTPVLDLRGFSFRYVDNAPCSGLVTFFDGRSYLFFSACGDFVPEDISSLFKQADHELRISEQLKREAHPNLYQ